MSRAIFLDRDGVINKERGDYTYKIDDFEILQGTTRALQKLKNRGYLLIVITNQSGISQGIYSREEMNSCHRYMNKSIGHLLDAIYYSPYHPKISASLSRKPDSLMFEKAISRFDIDHLKSWMIGDNERDLIPARKLGIKTFYLGLDKLEIKPNAQAQSLLEASDLIIEYEKIG